MNVTVTKRDCNKALILTDTVLVLKTKRDCNKTVILADTVLVLNTIPSENVLPISSSDILNAIGLLSKVRVAYLKHIGDTSGCHPTTRALRDKHQRTQTEWSNGFNHRTL